MGGELIPAERSCRQARALPRITCRPRLRGSFDTPTPAQRLVASSSARATRQSFQSLETRFSLAACILLELILLLPSPPFFANLPLNCRRSCSDPSFTMAELAVYDNDPTLYLFTSLTAGSSHIVTATSRIETILKANKIPFKGVDTATDDLARKLFQRRASGKKLPLLVKEGYVLGVST